MTHVEEVREAKYNLKHTTHVEEVRESKYNLKQTTHVEEVREAKYNLKQMTHVEEVREAKYNLKQTTHVEEVREPLVFALLFLQSLEGERLISAKLGTTLTELLPSLAVKLKHNTR